MGAMLMNSSILRVLKPLQEKEAIEKKLGRSGEED
jgi:hypothetical protein